MSSGVVTIGGQKYAVGLYWQLSPDTKNIPAAAKAAARQPGYQAEYYCTREATKARSIAQFGLGIKDSGHKAGMAVAAACMANQQPGSWVGAFNVPEGIWLIVIREDLIDLDGDALFTDEEEAQARLEQEIARGGIIKIYAPPEWGIDSADSSSVVSLMSGRKDVVLKRIDSGKRALLTLLAFLLVLGVGYMGFSWFQDYQARLAAEEAARQAELARQQQLTQNPTVQYKRDWETSPKPEAWLRNCEKGFQTINLTELGWKLGALECNGTAISVQWGRQASVPATVPDKAALDASLATANASFPLEPLPTRGAETLVSRDLINRLAILNKWSVSFQDIPDDVIMVPEGQTPPPPPPWRKRKVTFTLTSSPWSQIAQFEGYPGLVLTSLKLNGINWTLEGTFYETRTP